MRAKKFGVTLSDTVKKEARSARFNSNNSGSSAIAKTSVCSVQKSVYNRLTFCDDDSLCFSCFFFYR